MYIIVVGGGEIGYYLSKILLNEGHEVLILDKDGKRCEAISEELGSIVVHGDGCEAVILDDAGTRRADMLIAVTGDDEDNLVACQVAKHKFHVPKTVARIKNPKNETLFKKLGIDVTISSTELILAHIERELGTHLLIPLLKLRSGGLQVVEVKIPTDSKVVGKRLGDLSLPSGSRVALIISEERGSQIPTVDTVLQAGDEVVAVTKPDAEEALRAVLASA